MALASCSCVSFLALRRSSDALADGSFIHMRIVGNASKRMPLVFRKVCVYCRLMRLQDAVSYFGTQNKLADALGMSQGSMSSWKRDRIPLARALQVEKLTRGKLKVDMSLYIRNRRSTPESRA
jgi:hypothetical protein